MAFAILTGVHRPGESHFELLEAFVDDPVLAKISQAFIKHGYRPHEFGDLMLIERMLLDHQSLTLVHPASRLLIATLDPRNRSRCCFKDGLPHAISAKL